MRHQNETYEQDVISSQSIKETKIRKFPEESIESSSVTKTTTTEGFENFVNYIEWLGLGKDQNPVVLSSHYHFYYDAEEMKNVNTVINLKELNKTKQVKTFIQSIFDIMSTKSYLIGCFTDNSKINGYELKNRSSRFHKTKHFEAIENGIVSQNPFLNRLYSYLDSRTNNYMTKKSVSMHLKDHGFKVLDMTELNGLTYFCAQKPN